MSAQAVQRDLRAYIAKHSPRHIPVGYSAADIRDSLGSTQEYLQCTIDGETQSSASEFFGLNSYSWCGNSSFTTSGYNTLDEMFSNSSIPVFFSEYGCNEVTPRIFTEVPVLYGNQMTALSGGLVYEYSQEDSNYGLVQINSDGSIKLLTDYDNLRGQYDQLDLTSLEKSEATPPVNPAPQCDASLITYPGFSTNFTIPSIPNGGQDLINNGATGAHVGQLVTVSNTAVTQTVQSSNGTTLTGLAIKPLASDQVNTPGGSNTSPGKPKKGAAGKDAVNILGLALGLVVGTFVVSF